MKYILAGNHHQAMLYCRENKLRGRDAVLINSPNNLRGLQITDDDELVRYGTWYKREDLREVNEILQIIDRRTA